MSQLHLEQIKALEDAVFMQIEPSQKSLSLGKLTNPTGYLEHPVELNAILTKVLKLNLGLRLLQYLDILNIFKMYSLFTLVEQNPKYHPEGNLLAHMHLVMAQASDKITIVKLGALVHDFGKPISYLLHGNTYDHHESGLPYIEKFCRLMGVDNAQTKVVMTASEYHIRAHRSIGKSRLSAPKLLKLLKALDYTTVTFKVHLDIFRCDLLGRGGETNTKSIDYLKEAGALLETHNECEPVAILKLFVHSHEYNVEANVVKVPDTRVITVPQRDCISDNLIEVGPDEPALLIVGSRRFNLPD